ncbi:hypothetical protein [Halalkalibacter wakoensis]|uniref:hypothetical protein n=1 Tax=Halalkalibacter wakoensis TaxID=127891 RepID=UPI00068E5967|nr:hypothetical protein [Halalkalibacter wakoensis]
MAYEHGLSNTRLHSIWRKMKHRCSNPNSSRYSSYGGRGISLSPEWENDFMAFYTWAIQNGYEDHLTIERINVNGNYDRSNCSWITMKDQGRNKQNTLYVEFNGYKKPLIEWAEDFNIPYKTLTTRYYRGWRDERLFKR